MTITLAMHEVSHAHIRNRLEALDLDLRVLTFDDESFTIDGARVPFEEVEADYVWLSQHLPDRKHTFDMMLRMKRIDVLQTFNAGLDDPFYKRLAAKGTRICNSSAQGIAIAEYTIGQVMAVLQPIETQRAQQAAREWKVTRFREIGQTRWLIVGFGPIGQAIAHRVKAFGAGVDVIRRSPDPHADVDRMGTNADLERFAGEADVVVIAAPLTDATRGLAGAAFFAAIKPGAILVNIARGGLVDDAALMAALDSGQVATAILDVFHTEPLPSDDPLWSHPGVRVTPHTSFAGDGVHGRWDQLFLDNIQRYVAGEDLIREVDPAEL